VKKIECPECKQSYRYTDARWFQAMKEQAIGGMMQALAIQGRIKMEQDGGAGDGPPS
jgi:hypothetical protein